MLLINRVGRYEFPVIKANRQKKHKPNSRVGGGEEPKPWINLCPVRQGGASGVT